MLLHASIRIKTLPRKRITPGRKNKRSWDKIGLCACALYKLVFFRVMRIVRDCKNRVAHNPYQF